MNVAVINESDTPPDLEPPPARTPAEYVERLRGLKERSGLTYRQLEQRAAATGRVLPRSTAATMLARTSLPRAELVEAMVAACGGTTDDIKGWVDVRCRLASGTGEQSSEPYPHLDEALSAFPEVSETPAERPPALSADEAARPGRKKAGRLSTFPTGPAWALGGALVTAALVLVPGAVQDGAKSAAAPPAPPTRASPAIAMAGPSQLVLTSSRMCVSLESMSGAGDLLQATCSPSATPVWLQPQPNGAYRLATIHPRLGPGCLGVPGGDRHAGAIVTNDYCQGDTAIDFLVEGIKKPLAGFRIRSVHSGLCWGVRGDTTRPGNQVRQLTCDEKDAGQVFSFEQKKTMWTTG